jgi:hypothetical protein
MERRNADGCVRLELLGGRDDIRHAVVRTRFRSLPAQLRTLADTRAELVLHLFAPDWSERMTWLDAATTRALAGAGSQRTSHASIGVTVSYDAQSGILTTLIEHHAA